MTDALSASSTPPSRSNRARITPTTHDVILQLIRFATQDVPHGWHVTASDEELFAAVLGSHLRAIRITESFSLDELQAEYHRRIKVVRDALSLPASIDGAAEPGSLSDAKVRRLRFAVKRMSPGHALLAGDLCDGDIVRAARRASHVERLFRQLSHRDAAKRQQTVVRATDEVLIDAMLWALTAGATDFQPELFHLGPPNHVVDEIRARIDIRADTDLFAEACMPGQPDFGKSNVDEAAEIERYRLQHNLSRDHAFWTDQRIATALKFGMR